MRKLTALAVTALVSLLALSAGPSIAGKISFSRLSQTHLATQYSVRPAFCVPPAQLENICVSWGPGQPGQLFGPCLKYQLQCVSPTIVH